MSGAADTAREYFDAFNRHDWDRFRDLFQPDYSYTGGDGQKHQGTDAGVAMGQMFVCLKVWTKEKSSWHRRLSFQHTATKRTVLRHCCWQS